MAKKNIILFDWDDTLFPTTWAIMNEIKITSNKNHIHKMYNMFKILDETILSLFEKINKTSKIIIVTNAITKWVHLTARYLIKSYEFMIKFINIISARDLYQREFPNEIYVWKDKVFNKEILRFTKNSKKINSIISIGDADYEYKALIGVHYTLKSEEKIKYFKSIKFQQKVDMETMTDQLRLLESDIENIINLNRHLDLKFVTK